ncbi:SusC/RagA family TonB-linked outer membrane protein [Labilibaculum sp. A4]|uniref:SusC/RagA family TonB-linked outer membrane protein n=1 Tax=Labilibaculum euxinus TaxID=2686357 RepID=UPI000F619DD7|nr:TonB-dependent receptor [Labilibaculum euxinus]MDQ1769447.1 TonB-dependent receptor [Labilibaculum euxinus]MWN74971.1 SusC/RagA family TonB-linked outer membrane protein [Labilibaculum euxinus]
MKKLTLIVCVVLLSIQIVSAQTRQVTGIVTSADDGFGMPGVSVVIKGTTSGTSTDLDGNYSLSTKSGDILVFSFVGMTPQEISVGNQTVINVIMQAEAIGMDEVMVVAYGVSKKSSFTGSAATVKGDDILKSSATSFEEALQGSTAGVQVVSTSGQPGSATTVRIRGIGSINGVATPLYIIDGVAINSENYSQVADATNYGTSASPLSSLNPSDIENITILKDASASALYGSRAANGVILITTKQGLSGKTKVNFSAKYGFSDMAVDQHKIMNAGQYYKTFFDYYYAENGGDATAANASVISDFSTSGATINPYNIDNPYGANGQLDPNAKLLYDTDWRDEVYRIAKSEEYNISATGGNDKTKFYLSAGYLNQEGIAIGSSFERLSTKLNVSNDVTDFFKVGMNNTISITEQKTPPGAGGGASPVKFADYVSSVYPLYVWEDGVKTDEYNYENAVQLDFNPVALRSLDKYTSETFRVLSSSFAELKFLKDFNLKTQVSYDRSDLKENRFYNPEHGNGKSVNGRGDRYSIVETTKSITNTLNWSKTFNEIHTVGLLLGQEATETKYELLNAEATDFVFPGTDELVATAQPVTALSYFREKALSSYFSRLNYDYDGKYYFSASFRRDGSSIFGSDNKWGNFWSVAGSWRMSQEDFMSNLQWVDDLKIRASYGINGSDAVRVYERYIAMALFDYGQNYGGNAGIAFSQMANPNLKWEKLTAWDIAAEFRLFNRISGTVEYYSKISDGLLYDQKLSFTTGVPTVKTNIAEIENKGIEIELSSENMRNSIFSWTTSLNFSANKNKIKSLPEEKVIDGSKIWEEGSDRYQFYIQKFAGVDATDGSPTWYVEDEATKEITTTKVYSKATKFKSGSALPDFTAGLRNNFEYKGFDLSFMLYFSMGGKILDYTEADLLHMGSSPGTQLLTKVIDKAWKKPGDITDIPRFEVNNSFQFHERSTRFLHDNSFVRLRNITLGYDVPKQFLERYKLSSLRLYVQGDNIWTWQNHKGIDPEQSIAGTSNNNMPNIKTFSFGVKLGL